MHQQDKAFMTSFSIVLSVLVIIAISVYVIAGAVSDGASTHDVSDVRQQAAAKRLEPVGRVVEAGSAEAQAEAEAQKQALEAPAQVASADSAMSGVDVYNSGCNACHAAGVLNAPKLGDQAAWAERYQKGLDQLVHNAVNGINQMPAKGGNTALTEANIHDSIVYILTESGVDVPEAESAEAPAAESAEAPAAESTEAPATESAEAPAAESAESPAAEAPSTNEPAEAPVTAESPATDAAPEQQAAATTESQPVAEQSEAQPVAEESAPEAPASEQTAGAVVPADIDLAAGKQVYDMACFICHAGAVPNSPKLGDVSAWAPRLQQGWEVLVQHAINGYNAMPAKGGRVDLSDEQVTSAVGYMATQAQQ